MIYRWELIQSIIDTYGLKSYLEIGAGGLQNQNYGKIKCEKKIGIDPSATSPEYQAVTSDQFFASNMEIFDIVFVDGLHLCEQTIKDIVNSWNCLSTGGWIVLHDCLPNSEDICTRIRTTVNWTGDVWKAIFWFRKTYPDIFCRVVDMDWGCGVILKESLENLLMPLDVSYYIDLTYKDLQDNLELLRVVEKKDATIRDCLFTNRLK